MKKRIVYSLLGLISIICLCISIKIKLDKNASSKKNFIIGMSQSNLYEPWRINMNNEIKEEAEKYNNLKFIYKDAGGDVEKQKQDLNDLINFGADLLIVSINDSKELSPVIKEIYEKVPVIILDRSVEGDDYTLYIGGDMKSIGEQAGEIVNEIATDKKVKVIEVQGGFNSSPDEEINNGFKKVINKNVSINRTVVANWNKNEAQDKLEEILKEEEGIDVIFAHSDYMALGAYYAVKDTKRNNIKIIGVDGLEGKEGGRELVKNNILFATFTCETGGKEAVDYAVKILNNDENIPKKILLKCNKITRD